MARNTQHIRATRAQVFAVLADGWTYSGWVVGTSHLRAVEAAWPAVDSRLFHAVGSWPAIRRDDTRVEAMEPDRSVTLLARGRPFGVARVHIELADDGDGCLVTMHEEPIAGPGRWLHNPAADALLKRRNTESLQRLRAVVERPTRPME